MLLELLLRVGQKDLRLGFEFKFELAQGLFHTFLEACVCSNLLGTLALLIGPKLSFEETNTLLYQSLLAL